MKWIVVIGILMFFGQAALAACEIGGCGFGPPTSPEWDRARTAENNARMLQGLADCKAGREIGPACHGYCRGDDYRFDRARYCDRWGNFRNAAR